jgi:hypothetical protein
VDSRPNWFGYQQSGGREMNAKAEISFPKRETAQSFAIQWSRFSLRGHTLGARTKSGGASVFLDGLDEREIEWINYAVQKIKEAEGNA